MTNTPETDAAYTQRQDDGAWDFKVRQEKTMGRLERDELRAQLREEQRLHVQTRNELDAIRFASSTLKNSKGRFHTEQAATKLFNLIP